MRSTRASFVCGILFCSAVSAGCGNKSEGQAPPPAATAKEVADDNGFVGVDPLIFKCESITPVAEISRIVAGEVEQMPAQFRPPTGTPEGCNYQLKEARPLPEHQSGDAPGDGEFKVKADAGPPAAAQWVWSVTYDCREGTHAAARADMERMVGDGSAVAVSVGSYAVDAKGSALMFFDADSPCWVRIAGPSAEYRLAIATLVEGRLQAKNAPMRPRAAR